MKDYKAEIEKELKENCNNNLLREKKYLFNKLIEARQVIDNLKKQLHNSDMENMKLTNKCYAHGV